MRCKTEPFLSVCVPLVMGWTVCCWETVAVLPLLVFPLLALPRPCGCAEPGPWSQARRGAGMGAELCAHHTGAEELMEVQKDAWRWEVVCC